MATQIKTLNPKFCPTLAFQQTPDAYKEQHDHATRSFSVNLDEVLSFSNFMCNLEFFNFRVSINISEALQQPPPKANDDFELPAMADDAKKM
ncbi:DUF1738 domain-containing protein [Sesbania bispinosa]|nr:DUF1738 domain-containing protein [Sesbania bispinosa]